MYINIENIGKKAAHYVFISYRIILLLAGLSNHLYSAHYHDSLGLFTIVIVGCLTIRIVILHKFARNMCEFISRNF